MIKFFIDITYEVFILFNSLIVLFSLGHIFSSVLKISWVNNLSNILTGSLVYSFIISIFGLFSSLELINNIFVIFGWGYLIFIFYRKNIINPKIISFDWPLWSYLVFAVILGFYPSSYFDPLNYHLYGIVRWIQEDKLIFLNDAIPIMHNSYADYVFFSLLNFIKLSSQNNLMHFQVAAQLLTIFIGILSFSILLYQLVIKFWSKKWTCFLILALLARASLQHKGFIAKNDWIALTWFVFGISLIYESLQENSKKIFLGFFAIGMATGAKISYVLPLLLLLPLSLRFFKLKRLVQFISILAVALSPYFFRNYLWSGNPIYPFANFLTKEGVIGPSWIEGMKFFETGLQQINVDNLINKFKRFFTYEPICYFMILNYLRIKRNSAFINFLNVIFLLFFFIFMFFLGQNSEVRHFGPIALTINFLGVYALKILLESFECLKKNESVVLYSMVILMFYNFLSLNNELNPVPLSIREERRFARHESLVFDKRGFLLGKKYLEKKSNDSILGIIDDTPPYYYSLSKVQKIWDNASLDIKLSKCKTMNCIIDSLIDEKIEYLLDSNYNFDPYYNPDVQNAIRDLVRRYPESIFINDKEGQIISLKKLKFLND